MLSDDFLEARQNLSRQHHDNMEYFSHFFSSSRNTAIPRQSSKLKPLVFTFSFAQHNILSLYNIGILHYWQYSTLLTEKCSHYLLLTLIATRVAYRANNNGRFLCCLTLRKMPRIVQFFFCSKIDQNQLKHSKKNNISRCRYIDNAISTSFHHSGCLLDNTVASRSHSYYFFCHGLVIGR